MPSLVFQGARKRGQPTANYHCLRNHYIQGGSGTKLEPETGTVGTVFPETESGTATAGTVFQEPKRERNRPFLLNGTELQKNPFCRGTARTENRNRLNRSISKP